MPMKPWRAQVRGDHFVVLGANGDEILTSKEYADAGSAKRAARNFCEAMQRELVLEAGEDAEGQPLRESFRSSVGEKGEAKSSARRPKAAESPYAAGKKISPPQPGVSRHSLSPYAQ